MIDIQVAELPSSVFEAKHPVLDGFGTVKTIKRIESSVQFGPDKPTQTLLKRDEVYGWRYEGDDVSRVVQLRRNGITNSILRNYAGWDDIRVAAQRAWNVFLDLAKPVDVTRIAVRYINVLELPVGRVDFDEYLAAGPRIPPDLPQELVGFLHKVAVPLGDSMTAIITQGLEEQASSKVPVVVDLDVYREVGLKGNSPEVWQILDVLRQKKNVIFFSLLTEKGLEPYL